MSEFPKFNGTHVRVWLVRTHLFFWSHPMEEHLKVPFESRHLQDSAKSWYHDGSEVFTRLSCTVFSSLIHNHFGVDVVQQLPELTMPLSMDTPSVPLEQIQFSNVKVPHVDEQTVDTSHSIICPSNSEILVYQAIDEAMKVHIPTNPITIVVTPHGLDVPHPTPSVTAIDWNTRNGSFDYSFDPGGYSLSRRIFILMQGGPPTTMNLSLISIARVEDHTLSVLVGCTCVEVFYRIGPFSAKVFSLNALLLHWFHSIDICDIHRPPWIGSLWELFELFLLLEICGVTSPMLVTPTYMTANSDSIQFCTDHFPLVAHYTEAVTPSSTMPRLCLGNNNTMLTTSMNVQVAVVSYGPLNTTYDQQFPSFPRGVNREQEDKLPSSSTFLTSQETYMWFDPGITYIQHTN